MFYELLLDLAYIAFAASLIAAERGLSARGWELTGFSFAGISDPLAALFVGLFAITLFGLVLLVGAAGPVLIHDLATHGWRVVPGKAEWIQIGPLGNLAQIVGAGTAGYMYFRATWIVLLIAFIFGFLSNRYHF